MWSLSSPTRDQSWVPCIEKQILSDAYLGVELLGSMITCPYTPRSGIATLSWLPLVSGRDPFPFCHDRGLRNAAKGSLITSALLNSTNIKKKSLIYSLPLAFTIQPSPGSCLLLQLFLCLFSYTFSPLYNHCRLKLLSAQSWTLSSYSTLVSGILIRQWVPM